MLHHKSPINLSRLFLYYNSRILDGTQNTDSGTYLHNSFSTMQYDGCCLDRYGHLIR